MTSTLEERIGTSEYVEALERCLAAAGVSV